MVRRRLVALGAALLLAAGGPAAAQGWPGTRPIGGPEFARVTAQDGAPSGHGG